MCDHPVYKRCTLYLIGDKGLSVIRQRYDPETKKTWWTEIDPWITDGLYPTVRQIMWALKTKPIKKVGDLF